MRDRSRAIKQLKEEPTIDFIFVSSGLGIVTVLQPRPGTIIK